jgi:hypothetical protein
VHIHPFFKSGDWRAFYTITYSLTVKNFKKRKKADEHLLACFQETEYGNAIFLIVVMAALASCSQR